MRQVLAAENASCHCAKLSMELPRSFLLLLPYYTVVTLMIVVLKINYSKPDSRTIMYGGTHKLAAELDHRLHSYLSSPARYKFKFKFEVPLFQPLFSNPDRTWHCSASCKAVLHLCMHRQAQYSCILLSTFSTLDSCSASWDWHDAKCSCAQARPVETQFHGTPWRASPMGSCLWRKRSLPVGRLTLVARGWRQGWGGAAGMAGGGAQAGGGRRAGAGEVVRWGVLRLRGG